MSTINEQEEVARSLGGVLCDCSPETNNHMRMTLAPAGVCTFCGVEGPMYQQALRHAQATGSVDGMYGINELVPVPTVLLEPQNHPLKNNDGSVNWFAAFEATDDKVNWIVEPVLEEGMTHSLFGVPGHGKSLFVMETVVHHIIPGRHVLYLDSENHLTRIVTKRMKSFGATAEVLSEWLHFYSFSDIPDLDSPEGGLEILRLAKLHNAALVIIDTTSRFVDGPEDKADTWKSFYNYTMMTLKREDIATLRLDHPGKDVSRGTRGSSAKYGDIDYEFSIEDPQDGKTKYRKLTCTKGRTENASKGDVILLEKCGITEDNPHFYHKWVYEPKAEDIPADDADVQRLIKHGVTANMSAAQAQEVLRGAEAGISKTRVCAALKVIKSGSEPTGTSSEPENRQ